MTAQGALAFLDAPYRSGPQLFRLGRFFVGIDSSSTSAARGERNAASIAAGQARLVQGPDGTWKLVINLLTGEVDAPHVVGAFAAGKIVNPKAAKSQLMGGRIWGISAALHEATEIDRRSARFTNVDLSEYLIPVNADIQKVTTIVLPEQDTQVNDLGIKGIGELGKVGLNAAVANAVFHATGRRIRKLSIRFEALLNAPALPVK